MDKVQLQINKIVELDNEEKEELKKITTYLKRDGFLEYRDPECETFQEFLVNYNNIDETLEEKRKSYESRNAGGTYKLAQKLEQAGILESDTSAWHITYTFNFDLVTIEP